MPDSWINVKAAVNLAFHVSSFEDAISRAVLGLHQLA